MNWAFYSDEAGNVQAHYTYDAFGGTASQTGDMDDAFHFRFSSKYLDDETGLLYYGYRYLSPTLGRWVNRDPIEEGGGMNVYAIVGNSISFVDFLGLKVTGDITDHGEVTDEIWKSKKKGPHVGGFTTAKYSSAMICKPCDEKKGGPAVHNL